MNIPFCFASRDRQTSRENSHLPLYLGVPRAICHCTKMGIICHCIHMDVGRLPLYLCRHGLFATVLVCTWPVCHCICAPGCCLPLYRRCSCAVCHCIWDWGYVLPLYRWCSSAVCHCIVTRGCVLPLYRWLPCAVCHCITYLGVVCHCICGCRVRFATVSRTWGWFATVSLVVVCGLPLYHVLPRVTIGHCICGYGVRFAIVYCLLLLSAATVSNVYQM